MPFKVYIGEKFNYEHETIIFNSLVAKLKEKYNDSKELVVLIGNYYYNNQEFDATIIKNNAILVIDFKKYGGKIKFSENGKWYAGDHEVKGGNKKNPFIQLRTNKFALVNFFKNHHSQIVISRKEINYGHINAIVIFHNSINFINSSLPSNLKKWFHITDYEHCIELISKLTDKEINFTNDEILNIIKVLNVTDYYSFEESIELKINDFSSIKIRHELTKSQTEALRLISEFIDNKENKIFILNGAAGTGKTYLIKEIVSLLLDKEKSDFKILAPTGRSASNIREKIIHDIRTIHSKIYERAPKKDQELDSDDIEDNVKLYELFFDLKINTDSEETVYIIDECSLLSDNYYKNEIFNFGSNKLLSDVLNYINVKKSNRRLILIGDDKQIQKGKFEISALNENYFEKEHEVKVKSYELEEIVRYKENSMILKNALKIRKSLDNNLFNEFIIEYDDINIKRLTKENITDYYSSLDKEKTIIVKYRNEDCNRTNKWVKKSVLKKNTDVEIGDILMFHKNYFIRKANPISEYPDFDYIPNGEIGIVKWTSEFPEIIMQRYGRGANSKDVRLEFRDIIINLIDGREHKIKIFKNYLFSDKHEITHEELIGLIVRFHVKYYDKNNIYPNPKIIGIKKYYDAIQSDEYFNSARVKHAYSITCNKAQGSEWQNVIVDFSGFTGYKEDFYRWSYTAITRAVEKLFIINEPIYHPYINLNWIDAPNCLDFSINNILFFNKIDIIKPEIEKFSNFLSIPSIDPAFNNLFAFLYDIFLKNNIVIDNVEHNITNYYVRYFLNKSEKKVALNFIFDGQYNFKKPTIVNNSTNDLTFAKEVLNLVFHNNYQYNINLAISSTTKIYLKKFIYTLYEKVNLRNIQIFLVQHLDYIERIYFGKNNDLCSLDFSFNDDGFFKRVKPVKTNSYNFIEEIKLIVNDLKTNNN